MNKQVTRSVAALFAGLAQAWASASTLPAYETYSAAGDIAASFFSYDSSYAPLLEVTSSPDTTAQISGDLYTVSANTTLGSNHA